MVGIILCVRALISPHRSPGGEFRALGRDRTSGPMTLEECQGTHDNLASSGALPMSTHMLTHSPMHTPISRLSSDLS